MEQRLEVDTFLNAVVDTTVMQEAHSFLRYKGMTVSAEHCFTSQNAAGSGIYFVSVDHV